MTDPMLSRLQRPFRRAFHATLAEWHARAMNWHLDRVLRYGKPYEPGDFYDPDLTDEERDAFMRAIEETA
jgi:hypothetical protein